MVTVIIVGAGPTGIFAAFELLAQGVERVLLFDRGSALEARACPKQFGARECTCGQCHLLYGWGGAGAFSDGKLNLAPEVGGDLGDLVGRTAITPLIQEVDARFLAFGARPEVWAGNPEEIQTLRQRVEGLGLTFIPTALRHLGTDRARVILARMYQALRERVEIHFETPVQSVVVQDGRAAGVRLESGKVITGDTVLLAPGRAGASWLKAEVARLGLPIQHNPLDLGLRLEVPAEVLEPLTRSFYDPKLVYHTREGGRVRTFCVSPYGEVIVENVGGLLTVNGHSYADPRGPNTNFALLVSTISFGPFTDPLTYARYLVHLADLQAGGVVIQRMGDLRQGRASTSVDVARNAVAPSLLSAQPGDLRLLLPPRVLQAILEMAEVLDRLLPGINAQETLLYGLEVKYYCERLVLSPNLETQTIRGLYVAGDASGWTRGLVQSAASGLWAGRAIAQRLR